MTITLDIKPETERGLRRKAEQEGQDFSRYLETLLDESAEESKDVEKAEGSAYDLFAGRLGGIHGDIPEREAENGTSTEQTEKNKAAREALRKWRTQNATEDPEILEQRRFDWEELKQALNESHTSDRMLFP